MDDKKLTELLFGIQNQVRDGFNQVNGKITTLQQQVERNTQEIVGLKKRVQENTQQLQKNTQQLEGNTQEIIGLKQQVQHNTQQLEENTQEIAGLKQHMQENTQILVAVKEQVQVNTDKIDDLDWKLHDFLLQTGKSFEHIDTRFDKVEDRLDVIVKESHQNKTEIVRLKKTK